MPVMATASPHAHHVPVTAVIGAGPAGLLFSAVSALRWRQLGRNGGWPIYLFDKRDRYERSHRLRIDPDPFRQLQHELAAPEFDELIRFLDGHRFRPAVNQLETTLSEIAGSLGIRRELATIGTGPGELDLSALRTALVEDRRLQSDAHLTVVAADSVHSATRELVRGTDQAHEHLHYSVARLRVTGTDLPHHLGYLETFRFAKVLGSALDYRLNPNGYAEIDLFLDPAEHAAVEQLAATPRQPVRVTGDTLHTAPFFSAIVKGFETGLTDAPTRVEVQSTFRLEHRYQQHVAFDLPALDATVSLAGDAAISLPFFRGMAALTACVHQLAFLHADWAAAVTRGEHRAERILAARYQREVEAIRRHELELVRARSKLLRAAKEFIRISTLVPFPIQQWFLSSRPPDRGGRMTAGAAANMALAVAAFVVAIGAPLAGGMMWPPLGWLWLAAVPIQWLGGVAYAATRSFEPEPNPLIAAIWRLQIAALALIGLPVTLLSSVLQGRVAQIFGAVGWFLLGLVFAAGLVSYERIEGQRFRAGAFD